MITTRKLTKAFSLTKIAHNGPATQNHITHNIDSASDKRPDLNAILNGMTAKQLSVVLDIASYCFKAGRADTGAEMVDSTGVWIGGDYQQIIDLEKLGIKPHVAH